MRTKRPAIVYAAFLATAFLAASAQAQDIPPPDPFAGQQNADPSQISAPPGGDGVAVSSGVTQALSDGTGVTPGPPNPLPPPNPPQTKQVSLKLQRYFGYIGEHLTIDYSTGTLKETAGWSNTVVVSRDAALNPVTYQLLRANNIKAIIDLTPLWRPCAKGPGLCWSEDLYKAFKMGLPVGARQLILAFYMKDEPIYSHVDPGDLSQAACEVRSDFGSTSKILVIENSATLGGLGPRLSSCIDWAGFAEYGVKDPGTNISYQQHLGQLKSMLGESQWMVVALDAFWFKGEHGAAGLTQDDMAEVADNYYAVFKSDYRNIAMIGFLWPSLPDVSFIGSRELPKAVVAEQAKIGSKIISGK